MAEHFRPYVSSQSILIKEGKVLLLRRANSSFANGMYCFPGGHIEGNETARGAAAREALEEVGLNIAPEDLEMKVAMHRSSPDGKEYVDFFFSPKTWSGEIKNMEPEKCDDLSWFPLDAIPENTVPYIREAIRCYREGISYVEFGW